MNFFDKVCFNCCIFKKDKRKFVHIANEIIDKNLSVEFILSSFSKIENIKNLMLNEEQKQNLSTMPYLNFIKHYENLFAFHKNTAFQNNKKNYSF